MIKKLFSSLTLLVLMFGIFGLGHAYAVDPIKSVCPDDSTAVICTDRLSGKDDKSPFTGPDGVLTNVIQIFAFLLAVTSVIIIIISGIRFITSYGDAGSIKKARGTLMYAIIGLIVAGSAQALVSLILNNL